MVRKGLIGRRHPCSPAIVEVGRQARTVVSKRREGYTAASHRLTRSHGYATLSALADGTIEMIYDSVMLHNVTFVGKHVIVRLSGDDKVGAVPVLPVDEIAADGEGIIGVVGSGGIVSSKVEHHIQGAVGSR